MPLGSGVSGSQGVRTTHAPSGATARVSMVAGSTSGVRRLVITTARLPAATSARQVVSASLREASGAPASNSNSNWLGVSTSAAGRARVRRNSGMPGRTKMPRPTSPITGSQHHSASGRAALISATASRMASPIAASPR